MVLKIKWEVQSGTWTSSSNSSASDGLSWTCTSPGTSSSTVIRCTFRGVTSITFNCVYNGENNFDYLTVGKLDTACTRTSYGTSLKGTTGTTKDITYTCDENEHYVEFCYSKDSSVDTSPDNATVYLKGYSYTIPTDSTSGGDNGTTDGDTTGEIANGVYIVDGEGGCFSSNTEVSNAVGVAIVTDNCCFIMGLSYVGGIPWAASSLTDYNTDISSVPSSTSSTAIAGYYDGETYTNAIIGFFDNNMEGDSLTLAAFYAKYRYSITFKGTSLYGYLGSAGEWQAVLDNYEAVQTAQDNAGGFTIDWGVGTFYWTSCEYDSSYAWCARFYVDSDDFNLYNVYKDRSTTTRCVVPFYKVEKSDLFVSE